MKTRFTFALGLIIIALLSACTIIPSHTLQTVYPRMYQNPPASILILPPLNNSTAADAKEYFSCSLSEAVGRKGYYTLPVETMFTVLREEGLYDTENITPVVLKNMREHFGADAVLISTIEEWDKSWAVVEGSLHITSSFTLISTATADTLWDYRMRTRVELGSDSKKFLVQVLESAFKTAVEDYFPNCLESNITAMDNALPYGKHHPQFTLDAEQGVSPGKSGRIDINK